MTIGIYKIKNKVTGKFYIGSSVNLSKRKERHFRNLKNGIHENNYLQNAYDKYGKSAFEFFIIGICDKSVMQIEEQKQLDRWVGTEECYNICKIAGSPFVKGRKKSEEHRRKLSEATTRYFQFHPEARERNRNFRLGKLASKETRQKMIKSKKRGTQHHNSKITEEDVNFIRSRYIPREMSSRKLADRFGVDKATILNIIHRKTWTHI